MSQAVTFAAVAATAYAAHQAGDYWVQTSRQAAEKVLPGWTGRLACAAHVATYTLTLFAFLVLAACWLHLDLGEGWMAAGLSVSAVTHYYADRRKPLQRLSDWVGLGSFWRSGKDMATGAMYQDQAWHWAWLFVSALVISGGPR